MPTGIGDGVSTVILPSIESSLHMPAVGVDASAGSGVGGSVTAGDAELRRTGRGEAEYGKSQSMSPSIP